MTFLSRGNGGKPEDTFHDLGWGSTLSVLADSDEIGGLLSCSDSLKYVLLGLLCSEPLTSREARLSNVTRWGNGSLLAC